MLGRLRKGTPVYVVTRTYSNMFSEVVKVFIEREKAYWYVEWNKDEKCEYDIKLMNLEN